MLLTGCGGRSRQKATQSKPPPPPQMQAQKGVVHIKKGRIIYPNHGPRILVAESEEMTVQAGTTMGDAVLEHVSCELYQHGEKILTAKADHGKTYLQNKVVKLWLSGHVQAVDLRKSQTLTADILNWTSSNGQVSATNVQLVGYGLEHHADHALLSADMHHAAFNGHVMTQTQGFPK